MHYVEGQKKTHQEDVRREEMMTMMMAKDEEILPTIVPASSVFVETKTETLSPLTQHRKRRQVQLCLFILVSLRLSGNICGQ